MTVGDTADDAISSVDASMHTETRGGRMVVGHLWLMVVGISNKLMECLFGISVVLFKQQKYDLCCNVTFTVAYCKCFVG